jgi:PhnB protein
VRFYRNAFGADELLRTRTADGRVMHRELLVAGGRMFLHDITDHDGDTAGSSVVLHLYVPDVDAAFATALAEGAEALLEPQDTFWGDRYAMIRDPFGHRWSLGQRVEDLSVDEQEERANRWAADNADGCQP